MEQSTGSCDSRIHQRSGTAINVGDTERVISAAAGGLALLLGLSRLPLSSIVALVAGGALLYRGMTGHCRVYEALEVSTADDAWNAESCADQHHASRGITDVSLAATGESNPNATRSSR